MMRARATRWVTVSNMLAKGEILWVGGDVFFEARVGVELFLMKRVGFGSALFG